MSNTVQNTLFLEPVVDDQVLQIVSKFKTKQSCDYNGFNMLLIKSFISATNIVHPLIYIHNKSFESGIFPDEMKIAKIVPSFKNGDRK